jgi:hypothetical protein
MTPLKVDNLIFLPHQCIFYCVKVRTQLFTASARFIFLYAVPSQSDLDSRWPLLKSNLKLWSLLQHETLEEKMPGPPQALGRKKAMCDADKQATLEASPRAFRVQTRFGVLAGGHAHSGPLTFLAEFRQQTRPFLPRSRCSRAQRHPRRWEDSDWVTPHTTKEKTIYRIHLRR